MSDCDATIIFRSWISFQATIYPDPSNQSQRFNQIVDQCSIDGLNLDFTIFDDYKTVSFADLRVLDKVADYFTNHGYSVKKEFYPKQSDPTFSYPVQSFAEECYSVSLNQSLLLSSSSDQAMTHARSMHLDSFSAPIDSSLLEVAAKLLEENAAQVESTPEMTDSDYQSLQESLWSIGCIEHIIPIQYSDSSEGSSNHLQDLITERLEDVLDVLNLSDDEKETVKNIAKDYDYDTEVIVQYFSDIGCNGAIIVLKIKRYKEDESGALTSNCFVMPLVYAPNWNIQASLWSALPQLERLAIEKYDSETNSAD